ncbi:MAG: hypothetical protein IPG86_05110 [Chitinophagaceae bacterium]|nr:hypothetical protein [Chitinophagaceae bacterium]
MKSSKKARKPLQLINLNPNVVPRNYEPAAEHNFKTIGDWVLTEYGKRPLKSLIYLKLSAAATKVKNKGWINAINCRNIFAEGPNIDFVPQESFGGKIELWMENVVAGDSFAIQFRVSSGSSGMWELRSSETAMSQTPIIPVTQSIDMLIPPVEADYGLVLISLEAKFNNGGSWVFQDVIVKKIEY